MSEFLVDEFMQTDYEEVTFHLLVEAESVFEAFDKAAKEAAKKRPNMVDDDQEAWGFYFSADDLKPLEEGYRWAASDGSSVCYEVRKIR